MQVLRDNWDGKTYNAESYLAVKYIGQVVSCTSKLIITNDLRRLYKLFRWW